MTANSQPSLKVAYVGGNIKYGGWISFTAHLAKLLGQKQVFRITNAKARPRQFGYGLTEIPITPAELYNDRYIIAYIEPKFASILQFIPPKQKIIIHDPTELNNNTFHLLYDPNVELITVRSSIVEYLERQLEKPVRFIEKPFYFYPKENVPKTNLIGYCGRIDFDKGLVPLSRAGKSVDIQLWGNVNRRALFFTDDKTVKDFVRKSYKGTYDKTFSVHNKIYGQYEYMIDLSKIKNDGGGLQYTFMDAEYNDCTIIISDQWLTHTEHDMWEDGVNCYVLNSLRPADITDILQKPKVLSNHLDKIKVSNEEWKGL
jgi:hypothetical protein